MKRLAITLTALALATAAQAAEKPKWAIVIHGGAGVIERASMDAKTESAYRAAMADVLAKGSKVLESGGSSLDAIEAVIRAMEDDPLFNAGRGAVFTAEGKNELDAAIMDGSTLKAGSVAGVTHTRHPISLARAVMEKSPHVMLIGEGAETFGKAQGLEQVAPGYFYTQRRWDQLEKVLKDRGDPVPAKPVGVAPQAANDARQPDDHRFGTVGVVALDKTGRVAAGTSTGGTTGKRWNRVGDTPIIGAGTYASNDSCAVSATGTGEYFIRLTVAREICALVQYEKKSLQQAADTVIQDRLSKLGGDGGIIALAPDGQMAWSFNTSGMYRARAADGVAPVVSIYKDEK